MEGLEKKVVSLEAKLNERRQAESHLHASEQRYSNLLTALPVGIFRADAAGNYTYVNDRCCQLTGLAPETAIGAGWRQRLHPNDRDRVIAAWTQAVQAARLFQIECRFQRSDGAVSWVYGQAVAERDANGRVVGYVGVFTDISDRKEAEAQLQNLIAGTADMAGWDFFPALVSHIAKTLHVTHVMVSEQIGDTLHGLAFWANGALQSTFSYPLAKTPCERTLKDGKFYCEQFVQQCFPEDLDLIEMKADSYLGIVLRDTQGKAIGDLCIFNQQPIQDPQRAEQILRVFAARASAELERQRASALLEQLNQALEAKVEERTAALRASEAQIRTMIEAIPDLLMRVTRDGARLDYIQSRNQTGAFLPIQRSLSEVLPPELLQQQLDRIDKAIATGALQVYEHQFYKRDRMAYEEVRIGAISPDEALIIVRDVTDRKQAENALRESQQFIQTVLDTFPLSVFWKDRNLVFLGCNQNFLRDAGLTSVADIIGKTDYDMPWGQAGADAYRADDQQVIDSDTAKLGIVETQVQVDGSQIWLETNKLPLHNLMGEVVGVLGTYRDITDRKQAEDNLRQLSTRLNLAVESAGIGIWEWDITNDILIWDQRMYALYGISPEKFTNVYAAWFSRLHPDDRVAAETASQRALRGEQDFDTEYRAIHSDGSIRFIKANAIIQRNQQGDPQRMIGINFDITDLKESEVAMRRQLTTIEAAIDGIAIMQGNTYLYMNQAHLDLFGYERREDLIGNTWKLLYSAEEIERLEGEVFPAVNRDRAWQGEAIGTRKDGSTFVQGVSLTLADDGY